VFPPGRRPRPGRPFTNGPTPFGRDGAGWTPFGRDAAGCCSLDAVRPRSGRLLLLTSLQLAWTDAVRRSARREADGSAMAAPRLAPAPARGPAGSLPVQNPKTGILITQPHK
jgi:hypothetical protein